MAEWWLGGSPERGLFFYGAMKERRASGEYEERLMRRSRPGLPLVTAVRADPGYTSGLAHHSDDVGCARALLADPRGSTPSIIPVEDVSCAA